MKRSSRSIGIHRHRLSLVEEPERLRTARRGELMHQAIRFLDHRANLKEIELAVVRAFAILGEAPIAWTIDADFVQPLAKVLQLRQVREWFLKGLTRLPEWEIMDVKGDIHRTDLLVVHEGIIEIVDFKVGNRDEQHVEQVRAYKRLIEAIFGGADVRGFLLYIDEPTVVEVI